GFKGQVRGPDYKGLLRYEEIDRWSPIRVSEHPYDLELCDLCVRQCPIEQRADQCDAGKPPSGDENQCPPKRAIRLVEIDNEDGVRRMKPEILDGCVGCGVCEMICPLEESVFVMDVVESRGWAA
ncbi:MAG TPA: 4Fe-4S ferredoxin, partial [Gammaproteobacteria bacterium]|nr:4Fe-4S ferredoxin [Gammaproteobacteria bacterium]